MQRDIEMGLSVVGTVVEVFSLLQQSIDVPVVMSGLGQRRKIVKIRRFLKGTNGTICENWTQVNKVGLSEVWVSKSY